MSTVRQDAWSSDEDLILAEVVLRHIREGSTQLAAFEEVGQRLSRTAAACGFRWNSAIRKKYDAAIALAKKQRKKAKPQQEENEKQEVSFAVEVADEVHVEEQTEILEEEEVVDKASEITMTMENVIAFLQQYTKGEKEQQVLAKENEELKEEIEQLKQRNRKIEKEIAALKKDKEIINEDYRALIGIMDRARKMSILSEEDNKAMNSKS
ncbi:RsfA family transcriptional regulator [Alkalihalobacillus sp. LMS39]|uniref:RsfA family transcriptional regulator n=1 Tax=Alkalihalobacillus sp. LMS39 TaxID=2924032 RepID=UPI001FB378BB|nr:RsfA family transcriptional regulator [Alkalihalobacillus sp. LMS39]UOE92942.1 RsfA family transcriptional regulator [Alkalihalobacillus sp. LMS39]